MGTHGFCLRRSHAGRAYYRAYTVHSGYGLAITRKQRLAQEAEPVTAMVTAVAQGTERQPTRAHPTDARL